jgi:hypothetical protein
MMRSERTGKPGQTDPHVTLVLDLLKRAKTDRKDWKTWVQSPLSMQFAGNSAPTDVLKAADEALGGVFGAMMNGGSRQGAILPITSQNLIAAMAADEMPSNEEIPDSVLKMPSIVIFSLFFVEARTQSSGSVTTFPSIVYDFRSAPEEITPSMQWIKAPDKEPVAPPKLPVPPQPAKRAGR